MAFLMLMHEKLKLQRNQSKLTLKQLRVGNKLSRIKRNIEAKQKYYQKLESNLEQQAKRLESGANLYISNAYGVGTNNGWNPNNYFGSSIMTATAKDYLNKMTDKTASNLSYKDLINAYVQNRASIQVGAKDELGNPTEYKYKDKKITPDEYNKITSFAGQLGQIAQSDRMMAEQYRTDYSGNVSIWLAAQKEAIEAEQDMVLDALHDEESDYELEKTCTETEMEFIKGRLEAIKNELAEGVKDSAPKFGLG